MAQLNKDNADQIIKLLKSIFNEIIDEDDLQKVLFNPATLYSELDDKIQARKYYIRKHKSLIFLDKIDEQNKRNEEERKKKRNIRKFI